MAGPLRAPLRLAPTEYWYPQVCVPERPEAGATVDATQRSAARQPGGIELRVHSLEFGARFGHFHFEHLLRAAYR
jgi:hypothetical protein